MGPGVAGVGFRATTVLKTSDYDTLLPGDSSVEYTLEQAKLCQVKQEHELANYDTITMVCI